MAASGVKYSVEREATDIYNEQWNGVQKGVFHHDHYFKTKIDPYKIPGNPSSGLLARISAETPGNNGTGEKKFRRIAQVMYDKAS